MPNRRTALAGRADARIEGTHGAEFGSACDVRPQMASGLPRLACRDVLPYVKHKHAGRSIDNLRPTVSPYSILWMRRAQRGVVRALESDAARLHCIASSLR